MVTKMGYGTRKQAKQIHSKIVDEYELMRLASNGKGIKNILNILADKYGYSCGQAVRNVIVNHNKKNQKQTA